MPSVAMLATVGQDGYPQVTALWFFVRRRWDAQAVAQHHASKGEKFAERHAECTLFILDTANPYRTLEVRSARRRSRRMWIMRLPRNSVPNTAVPISAPNDRPGETAWLWSLSSPSKANTWGSSQPRDKIVASVVIHRSGLSGYSKPRYRCAHFENKARGHRCHQFPLPRLRPRSF